MSLKSLPFVQRIHALKKEVINKIHERKELEKDKIQQAEVKSIGYRECWPIDQLKKIKQSLLPSLTHDNDGIVCLMRRLPMFMEMKNRVIGNMLVMWNEF